MRACLRRAATYEDAAEAEGLPQQAGRSPSPGADGSEAQPRDGIHEGVEEDGEGERGGVLEEYASCCASDADDVALAADVVDPGAEGADARHGASVSLANGLSGQEEAAQRECCGDEDTCCSPAGPATEAPVIAAAEGGAGGRGSRGGRGGARGAGRRGGRAPSSEDGGASATAVVRGSRRATLCVSSQVGCQMGCTFCATGE